MNFEILLMVCNKRKHNLIPLVLSLPRDSEAMIFFLLYLETLLGYFGPDSLLFNLQNLLTPL